MKFKFTENIKELPGDNGNAYSSSKFLFNMINVTAENTIASNRIVDEAVDFTFDKSNSGGVIVLSTDVNAIKLDENKFINKIKQIVATISNRVTYNKKIDTVAQANKLIGWTVGRFLSGRYTSRSGVPYDENSLSVELIGIDKQTLIEIAEELCDSFIQEEVLVKDYSEGNIYFVSGNKY